MQRVAAENGVGRPRIRRSTMSNGGGRRGVYVTWSSYLKRVVRTRPSRLLRDQSLFYRLRPAVVGTRSSVGGGSDGGCRVVRAGWSSYPTGVLRARTYSSGHVVLVAVC